VPILLRKRMSTKEKWRMLTQTWEVQGHEGTSCGVLIMYETARICSCAWAWWCFLWESERKKRPRRRVQKKRNLQTRRTARTFIVIVPQFHVYSIRFCFNACS
jgi:hypothetical protein